MSKKKQTTQKRKSAERRRGPDGLLDRERAFVHAYVQTLIETGAKGNGTLACKRIGIPPHQAPYEACEMMKRDHVKSAIQALHEEMLGKYDITSERILFELAKMGFTGMSKFAFQTKDGRNLVFDFSNCTEDELDAISEVTVEEYQEGKGDNARDVKRTKIKLGRKEALELLGKHKKLFVDRTSLENPDGSPIVPPTLNIGFVEAPPRKDTSCQHGSSGSSESSSTASSSSEPSQSS